MKVGVLGAVAASAMLGSGFGPTPVPVNLPPRRWGKTATKRIEYLKLARGPGITGTREPYDVVAARKRRKAQRVARRAGR